MSNIKCRLLMGFILGLCLVGSTYDEIDDPHFWLGTLVLSLLLLFSIRRSWAAFRQSALVEAGRDHFVISTECFLDWEALIPGFDRDSLRLLESLVDRGRQDGRALRPGLEKAAKRMKRLGGRLAGQPGPWAYRAWCLSLLSRIAGLEALVTGGPNKAAKLQLAAEDCRRRALDLAGEDLKASIIADWGLALAEDSAEFSGWVPGSASLKAALTRFKEAVALNPELAGAWRGQGRVLGFLAYPPLGPPRIAEMERAVEMYETARRGREWNGDFYDEFGLLVLRLAENHPFRAIHFYRYAAKLFLMAGELGGEKAASLLMAGKSLYLAGLSAENDNSETAASLYREALEPLKLAGEIAPTDHWSFLWAARCLYCLGRLREREDKAAAGKCYRRAADYCSKAAAASPVEEVFAEWANILSAQAEAGGSEAPLLWRQTAEKYGRAVACEEIAADRAAVNWHNWGYALAGLAATVPQAAERRKILLAAAVRYRQAARLNGDNLVTLKNLGDTLGDLAEMTAQADEAQGFYDEAERVFSRATELYPEKAGPWRRWGALMRSQALAEKNPTRRRELWEGCLDKLRRGALAEPANLATWRLWGQVLSLRYWESPEHERPLLIDDIIDKYERAAALNPEDDEVWSLMGRSRLEASELPPELPGCCGALAYAQGAVRNLETACRLDPEYPGHWADWGRALFRQAQLTDNDASALAALAEARDKFVTAAALDPANSEHHASLAHVLYQWAWRLEEAGLKGQKFKEAYRHCALAGNLAPLDPVVWRNWAKVTEALANVEKDPHKSFDWQNEANEKYYHADTLDTGGLKDRRH